MEKYEVIKVFPKGGALAKNGKDTIFVKGYDPFYDKDVKSIYVDKVKQGPKGFYVSENDWHSHLPISLDDLELIGEKEIVERKLLDFVKVKKWKFKVNELDRVRDNLTRLEKEAAKKYGSGVRLDIYGDDVLIVSKEYEIDKRRRLDEIQAEIGNIEKKYKVLIEEDLDSIIVRYLEGASIEEARTMIEKVVSAARKEYAEIIECFKSAKKMQII